MLTWGDVILTGEVSGAPTPEAFTTDGAADPLLVVEIQKIPVVGTGQTVEVPGSVEVTCNAVTVEEELGTDPGGGGPYLTAARAGIVERSAASAHRCWR